MSLIKQVLIHHFSDNFGLPREMAHEILGFCFYDMETAVYRAIHKANTAEVIGRFDNAWLSRANHADMHDNCETWAIHLTRVNHEEDDEVQFQASNCSICGNYKLCGTHEPPGEEHGGYDLRLWRTAIPICMRCCCD